MEMMRQILQHYFPYLPEEAVGQLQEIGSGVNNMTRCLLIDGQLHIMRIYQNHQNPTIVAYEHNVLKQLAQMEMSFQTPKPIPTQTGQTYLTLPDGRIVALFTYIEGTRCRLDNPVQLHSIGAAMGELLTAMATIQAIPHPVYASYAHLYEVHPLVTRDTLFQLPHQPEWAHLEDALQTLLDEVRAFETSSSQIIQHLPCQLIHADFVETNLLVNHQQNQVSGILDFEFTAPDVRIMELACFLTTLLKEAGSPWQQQLSPFLQGYGSTARLTPAEITAIPLCMKNRRIVSFIHYLGRQLAGLDTQETTETQLTRFLRMNNWLQENKEQLLQLVTESIEPC
ncbi:phosphotransferase enzyme family protein [Brevibacillus dissolubilis]|uniref:phosphotransferase enzyme family protein n=1 Tax=Brevibacillus dissolubilis TaxID=1844116 RepID=UPI001115EC8B|nr:phosphotransferase [Brevibacillus dissolubilis]